MCVLCQNLAVIWESTDQFGNMFIGVSDSTGPDGLYDELLSLATEVGVRRREGVVLTVDFGYGEINGPDPEEVTHVLQVPWLAGFEDRAVVTDMVETASTQACSANGWSAFVVREA